MLVAYEIVLLHRGGTERMAKGITVSAPVCTSPGMILRVPRTLFLVTVNDPATSIKHSV